DREERPDLDDIYMSATVAMTGHGGGPVTGFLTPAKKPFFAGTDFPPQDRHGMPGFPTVLPRPARLGGGKRRERSPHAAEVAEHVRAQSRPFPSGLVRAESIDRAAAELARSFDSVHGGFGGAPKFPPSASLLLLLRLHNRRRDPGLLTMVTTTLDAMKN